MSFIIWCFTIIILVTLYIERIIKLINYKKLNLRHVTYYDLLCTWLDNHNKGYKIDEFLQKRNIKSIGIYGGGKLGELLYGELEKCSSIEIKYIIDKIQNKTKFGGLPIISPDKTDYIPEVDAVIVTPVYDYEIIKTNLSKNFFGEILNLEEVVYSASMSNHLLLNSNRFIRTIDIIKPNIVMISMNNLTDGKFIGVFKKMFGQVNAFLDAGFDTKFIFKKDNFILKYNIQDERFTFIRSGKRSAVFMNIIKYLIGQTPDILYIRYPRSDLYFLLFLKKFKKFYPNTKILIEFPTFPYEKEIKNDKKTYWNDKFFRRFISRYVDFCVCYNDFQEIYGIPAVNIGNGIELESMPLVIHKKQNGELHLLGLGNITFWQGYDRVINGIHQYYQEHVENNRVDIYFHIVGTGNDVRALKKIVENYNLGKYVLFHGTKDGKVLDEIYNMCQIAVGPLGWHRKGIYEGAALKTREYCARGLPFILSHKDRDFPNEFPYALQFSMNDLPVDMEEIIKFYEKIYRDNDFQIKMREYAEKNLTWQVKLQPVINRLFPTSVKD